MHTLVSICIAYHIFVHLCSPNFIVFMYVLIIFVCTVCVQVSCLGLEDSADGDPCKFTLTSRMPNGSIEAFLLHSSHPGVRQVWTLQINQILETQRNFLTGITTALQCFALKLPIFERLRQTMRALYMVRLWAMSSENQPDQVSPVSHKIFHFSVFPITAPIKMANWL